MKELIDYFNERYTRKKEYICKDLKPVKLLNDDEYSDFRNDAGLINPQEIHYYPLFKVPKIKDNRPASFGYILKTDDKEYKGIMRQRNNNEYGNNSVKIVINEDEVVLDAYGISINVNNCFLTLYIDSPELPKLEYPKNKMDMYRATSFILTVCSYTDDDYLWRCLVKFKPLPPENIDEANLYSELNRFPEEILSRKDSYFLTKKDNYYTVLDAIKKGKSIYYNRNIYPNWKINKEEKSICIKNSWSEVSITIFEYGFERPPM